MIEWCVCGVYRIETEYATYVRDGKPMCNSETCRKVKETRHLRRVPFFDEEVRDTYEKE